MAMNMGMISINEYGTQILVTTKSVITFYNDWNDYEKYESTLTISKIEILKTRFL